jgi:hypothetical protein
MQLSSSIVLRRFPPIGNRKQGGSILVRDALPSWEMRCLFVGERAHFPIATRS